MNTLTIDIRKAELKDAAAIADVHQDAWRGAYSGIIPHRALNRMINRRGPDWWANAIRRAATVLVIEIGGKLAGYATIGKNRARELSQQGEIYELYLRPGISGHRTRQPAVFGAAQQEARRFRPAGTGGLGAGGEQRRAVLLRRRRRPRHRRRRRGLRPEGAEESRLRLGLNRKVRPFASAIRMHPASWRSAVGLAGSLHSGGCGL